VSRYAKPISLDEALTLLGDASWRMLAGGTDFYPAQGARPLTDNILDLNGLDALRGIAETATHIVIGARTTWSELLRHPLPPAFNALKQAAREVGSVQIQNIASIAGNLCNASPAADSVPALVAAGARASIVGPGGRRTIAVEAVPTAPGKTSLAKGEIIDAILLDRRPARSADAYLRFIPRTEMDIAVVSAGVSLTIDEAGTVTSARVALGAVAPTVLLVEEAARILVGTKADAATLQKLEEACSTASRPIDDKRGTVAFRKQVAGVMARRAATIAYARAGDK